MVAPQSVIHMAYSQADLDTIDAEIAKIRTVDSMTKADQTVRFRSLEELTTERARIAAAIATASGTSRVRYASTSKGV